MYITSKNIREPGVQLDDISYVEESVYREIYQRCPVQVGDVLLIKDGANTGISTVNQIEEEYSLLSSVALLKPDDKVLLPRYLKHFLNSPVGFQLVTGKMSGSAIKRIILRRIKETTLSLPPLPEQHRIVEKIEELFSDLDAGVAALRQVQQQLQRYRQAVLKAAVEGKLTEEWRSRQGHEVEPADVLLERILAERRRKWEAEQLAAYEAKGKTPPKKWQQRYKEPAAPDTSDLPELPEGWEWFDMNTITVFGPQNGLYLPKSAYGNGMPILRIDDYQFGWSRASEHLQRVSAKESDIKKFELRARDLVINRVNSPSHLGKCVIIRERNMPSLFESNMMRLELSSHVNVDFVNIYLRSISGRKRLTANAKWAVNQASINQQDVSATRIPLPSKDEQCRIVEEVENLFSVIDDIEVTIITELQRAERLRQSILKRAFEGELAPQDPTDEPASVLLERIRNEKKHGKAGDSTTRMTKDQPDGVPSTPGQQLTFDL